MNARSGGRLPLGFLSIDGWAAWIHSSGPPCRSNVNTVSRTERPNGDPHLQQQNEPTSAVSSHNSKHLLSGANDYRVLGGYGLSESLASIEVFYPQR